MLPQRWWHLENTGAIKEQEHRNLCLVKLFKFCHINRVLNLKTRKPVKLQQEIFTLTKLRHIKLQYKIFYQHYISSLLIKIFVKSFIILFISLLSIAWPIAIRTLKLSNVEHGLYLDGWPSQDWVVVPAASQVVHCLGMDILVVMLSFKGKMWV